jgi:hypothetical protein
MLTNRQLEKLQKAGCPGIEMLNRPGLGKRNLKDPFEYTSPTVEEMMGWLRNLAKKKKHSDVCLAIESGGWKADCQLEMTDGMIYEHTDHRPDALSALYDLWERLEAK